MPLFGWTKQPRRGPRPEGAARTLLRELQWHLEQRELETGPGGDGAGADPRGLRGCRVPHASIPAAEQRRLEALCSHVQPHHTGAVLSRFREVLAENDVLPWEIVYVFKQVLEDALGWDGRQPGGLAAGGSGGPTQPARPGHCAQSADRDELPTVSSYVDRHREGRLSALARGTRNLPCDHRPARMLGREVFRGPPPGQGAQPQE